MALNLKHQTPAQLAARFREQFKAASGERAGKMARWLIDRIQSGDVTDAQMRSAFGLTTTQYNAMKTRMTTLANQYSAVVSARGE